MAGVKECNHDVNSELKSGLTPPFVLSIPLYLESNLQTVYPSSRNNSFQKNEVGTSRL